MRTYTKLYLPIILDSEEGESQKSELPKAIKIGKYIQMHLLSYKLVE